MDPRRIGVYVSLLGVAMAVAGSRRAVADTGPRTGADRAELEMYVGRIEAAGIFPGSRPFLLAVALRESGFNRLARNTSKTEAAAAARGFERAIRRGYFTANPYRDDPERWAFGSGGLFGFLPSTGLSQGGEHGPWQRSDPHLVFDVPASLAMALAYIRGLMRQFQPTGLGSGVPAMHQNWFAIRRGWASPALVHDWNETKERSRSVRERLVTDIGRAMGVSKPEAEAMAERRVIAGNWRSIDDVIRVIMGDS